MYSYLRLSAIPLLFMIAEETFAFTQNRLIETLKANQVGFGTFVREKTPEAAKALNKNNLLDFLFYDMEHSDFDIATLEIFLEVVRTSPNPLGVIVRIPPIHLNPSAAKTRVEELIALGVGGIAFPHIMSVNEAEKAVSWIEATTSRMWPKNLKGDFISFMMIEDPEVIPQSETIAKTEGLSVLSPGPGSLRNAYDRDIEKVRKAVGTVLEACLKARVPCANTANENDVKAKVKNGFRLLITLSDKALKLGRKTANR